MLTNPETTKVMSVASLTPYGFSWTENSCAYDSVLSILHSIWNKDSMKWNDVFRNMNNMIMGPLLNNFTACKIGLITLNSCRDNLCFTLQQLSPENIAWGEYTSVTKLLDYMLETPGKCALERTIHCYNEHVEDDVLLMNTSGLIAAGAQRQPSVQSWMTNFREDIVQKCNICESDLYRQFRLAYPLSIVALDISGHQIEINRNFRVTINSEDHTYILRGIIYFSHYHFTAQIVYENGLTWFHDGIATL